MADGASQTIAHSYQLDLGSETKLQIRLRKLLFDDVNLSKVIDDERWWYTRMEVLDLIHHQFFFTASSLGLQPTTSQFFHPLTLQIIVPFAAAIHCAPCENATGKKVTVMFSQDEYQGKFCSSTVIDCINAEATALLINDAWWAASYPISPMVLLR